MKQPTGSGGLGVIMTSFSKKVMITSLLLSKASGAIFANWASTVRYATSCSASASGSLSAIDWYDVQCVSIVIVYNDPPPRPRYKVLLDSLRVLEPERQIWHVEDCIRVHISSIDQMCAWGKNYGSQSKVVLMNLISSTYLSCGASLSSHFTTAASACKLTSTSSAFFSSAIALANSPTCGLYRAGQCFDV